jgi:hypothetical protein
LIKRNSHGTSLAAVVFAIKTLPAHLSVTTDTLLEPIPNVPPHEAVRLVLDVTIRPYRGFAETAGYV